MSLMQEINNQVVYLNEMSKDPRVMEAAKKLVDSYAESDKSMKFHEFIRKNMVPGSRTADIEQVAIAIAKNRKLIGGVI